jgi:hypothetical protein
VAAAEKAPRPRLRKPEEPPHLRARRELRELEARGWFEQGRVKPYYFGVSEILRRYSGRPCAAFRRRNTPLRRSPAAWPPQSRDRELLPLLRQADMVKFADLTPSQARKDEDLKAVLQYLADTAPGLPARGETEARSMSFQFAYPALLGAFLVLPAAWFWLSLQAQTGRPHPFPCRNCWPAWPDRAAPWLSRIPLIAAPYLPGAADPGRGPAPVL